MTRKVDSINERANDPGLRMVNVLPFIPQADRVMRMASDVNDEFFCY